MTPLMPMFVPDAWAKLPAPPVIAIVPPKYPSAPCCSNRAEPLPVTEPPLGLTVNVAVTLLADTIVR